LSPDLPDGLCPACLLTAAVNDDLAGDDAPATADLPPLAQEDHHLPRIRNYHLIELIGEGGMGVVYKVKQREPPGNPP
jgi:serine/threonine protein kinase